MRNIRNIFYLYAIGQAPRRKFLYPGGRFSRQRYEGPPGAGDARITASTPRTELRNDLMVDLEVGAADKVYTVGNRGKDRFKTLSD